jgi:hypothetical protein
MLIKARPGPLPRLAETFICYTKHFLLIAPLSFTLVHGGAPIHGSSEAVVAQCGKRIIAKIEFLWDGWVHNGHITVLRIIVCPERDD